MNSNPSASLSPLRRLWLALTGGADGCPRRRFFLSLLPLVVLDAVATRILLAGILSAAFALGLGCVLVVLPALIGMVMSGVAGGLFVDGITRLFRELGLWEQLPLPEIRPGFGLVEGTGPHPLYCIICSPVIIVAGGLMFGLAWRRLRDAGYSPKHLLAGLWAPLMYGVYFCFNGEILGGYADLLVYNLGHLWLLWLYCQPSRKAE